MTRYIIYGQSVLSVRGFYPNDGERFEEFISFSVQPEAVSTYTTDMANPTEVIVHLPPEEAQMLAQRILEEVKAHD